MPIILCVAKSEHQIPNDFANEIFWGACHEADNVTKLQNINETVRSVRLLHRSRYTIGMKGITIE